MKFLKLFIHLSFSFRETHAKDWPSTAGVHVLELHVAEDESGGSTIQVRDLWDSD